MDENSILPREEPVIGIFGSQGEKSWEENSGALAIVGLAQLRQRWLQIHPGRSGVNWVPPVAEW
jgi:hypothetical protein